MDFSFVKSILFWIILSICISAFNLIIIIYTSERQYLEVRSTFCIIFFSVPWESLSVSVYKPTTIIIFLTFLIFSYSPFITAYFDVWHDWVGSIIIPQKNNFVQSPTQGLFPLKYPWQKARNGLAQKELNLSLTLSRPGWISHQTQ